MNNLSRGELAAALLVAVQVVHGATPLGAPVWISVTVAIAAGLWAAWITLFSEGNPAYGRDSVPRRRPD